MKTQYQEKKASRMAKYSNGSDSASKRQTIDPPMPKAPPVNVVTKGGYEGSSVPGMITNTDRSKHIAHQNKLDSALNSRGKGAFKCGGTK